MLHPRIGDVMPFISHSICVSDDVMPTPTSIALVSMRVSLKGIFSGNFSLVMATSKQSPKSM